MSLTVIGSSMCVDTKKALMALDEVNASYELLDILTNLDSLKGFIKEWDTNPLYSKVKKKGTMGIPLFVLQDGTKTLSLNKVLQALK